MLPVLFHLPCFSRLLQGKKLVEFYEGLGQVTEDRQKEREGEGGNRQRQREVVARFDLLGPRILQ